MKLLPLERLHRIERFLWALTLVAVPVTSFRFMPFMGADSQVRPLSLIPVGLLLIVLQTDKKYFCCSGGIEGDTDIKRLAELFATFSTTGMLLV